MPRLIRKLVLALVGAWVLPALADSGLLNASYDVSRDFYKDYNPIFQKYWKVKSGESVELKQSHAGRTGSGRSRGGHEPQSCRTDRYAG